MKTSQLLLVVVFGLAGFNLSAATLYVSLESTNPTPPYTNWATAARVIQDAVDAAAPGDTVLVTNGLYATVGRPVGTNLLVNRVAIEKPIRLESVNGPAVTIIQGAPAPGGGNGERAVRCVYLSAGAVLSGFTLTKGHTKTSDNLNPEASGGGVWSEMSGLITNCVMTGNSATWGGGAAGGILKNCTITGNSSDHVAGGAYSSDLHHCTVKSNTAGMGGGVSYGRLYNCTVTDNSAAETGGGAVLATLYNCVLTGNSVRASCRGCDETGGGASVSTLYNCILNGNSAGLGGGAWESTLYNCTLTGNSARKQGGGVYRGVVYNCIVYFNSAPDQANHFAMEGEENLVFFSCTTPLPTNGVGNITLDPQLASDSHLSASSPCIGVGNPAYASGMDIDGEPWPNPPSMGADGLVPGSATGPLSMHITVSYTNVAPAFPVAFTAHNTGRITQSVWDFGGGTLLTNQALASHAWNTPGTHIVRLIGYNDTHPEGVSTTVVVEVVGGAVYYVNVANPTPVPPYTGWATAATNIQDAVDAGTVAGALVLVSNGVYATGGRAVVITETNRVAVSKPLMVRSVNGPEQTIIEGEANGVRCAWVGNGAILSGFTLTKGNSGSGGGVWCEPGAVVTNCTLTSNSALNSGGGASGGTLINCILTGNSAIYGGGASGATLYGCTVKDNRVTSVEYGQGGGDYYGGLGGGASYSTLSNCTLTGNSAMGVFGSGGGAYQSTLNNCELTGNSAYHGGGVSGGNLYNCTLTGNSAENGGGASEGTLNNCTLTGNSARSSGGGAFQSALNNCILYYNTAPDGNYDTSSTLNYCCTTPLPTNGSGNITGDPRFVNAAVRDFRLRTDSPCLDTGSNPGVATSTDITGLARVMDGNYDGIARVDIGAYELNPYRFEPTLSLTGDGFRFTVHGEPGRSVRIERSRDLVHWEFAGEVPIPASGQTLIDPAATVESRLFYRAMRVP